MNTLRFSEQSPVTPDAQLLLGEFSAILTSVTGNNGQRHFLPNTMSEPGSYFVVAYRQQLPAACGSLQRRDADTAELKRIYTRPNKTGDGSQLLQHLEGVARQNGYLRLVCETRTINTAAVAFYLKNHYHRIENYGPYQGRYEAICFEKML